MNEIIMKPVNMQIYKNVNLEPQYVSIRSINSANLFIDSSECKLELDKTNMLISTIKSNGDRAATLFTNICRVEATRFTMFNVTPAVNNRNNTVRFFSSVSGIFHTVQIPESFYNDPVENKTDIGAMIDALIDALNTATGSSGLAFSATTDDINFPKFYNLICVGGNFYFDENCDCVKKGLYTYNLPGDNILEPSKLFGPIGYVYTSYIDICSNMLTKYQKIADSSTGYNNNIIARIEFDATIDNFNNAPYSFNYELVDRINFNYNHSDSVSFIDIQIRDQWGDIYYVPERYKKGFKWNLVLRFEA